MNGGTIESRLRALSWVSGAYDLALAVPMLLAPAATASLFGAPAPVPVMNAQLNGVFTLSLAAGYFWAAGDPLPRRGYLWVAGVLAKLVGAALFVADHFLHASLIQRHFLRRGKLRSGHILQVGVRQQPSRRRQCGQDHLQVLA